MEEKRYYWEGNVGIKVEMKTNSKTGEQFPTFEPVRCYKVDGDDEWRYAHNFSRDEMERLAPLVNQAIAYADGSEPEEYAA
jgi:hypothetical protein